MSEKLEHIKEKARIIEEKTVFSNINFKDLGSYFILYSVLGWIMETVYMTILNGTFTNRGFLFTPMCPIYGYGITILILLLSKYKNKPIKLFLSSVFILSIFEYIVSFALQAMFSKYWWNYSDFKINLNGRICLLNSICWGFLSIIFFKWIHPLVTKFLSKIDEKINNKIQYPVVSLLLAIYVTDSIISIILAFYGNFRGIV